jgi:hypothetical protein
VKVIYSEHKGVFLVASTRSPPAGHVSPQNASSAFAMALPATFQKLSCHTLSTDFRKATAIVSVPLVAPSKNNVVIAVQHVGINASDVNVC